MVSSVLASRARRSLEARLGRAAKHHIRVDGATVASDGVFGDNTSHGRGG